MNHADDFEPGDPIECWNCAGEGYVSSCFEEFACIDPESGCDDCTRRCDVCGGKGGWLVEDRQAAAEARESENG